MDEKGNGPAPDKAQWDGGPNAIALLVVVIACAVLWRQVGSLWSWWWDKANDLTGSGQVVLFALGVAAALLAVLLAMVAIEKVLRLLRDLGRSMGQGWRRQGSR